jgi:hypothetical protein
MSKTSQLEEEIQMLRREREQLGLRLLELQRRVAAAAWAKLEDDERRSDIVEAELRRQIGELEAENVAIRGTLSWRLMGPARKLRRHLHH